MASSKIRSLPVEIELKYSLNRSEHLQLKHFLKSVSHKTRTQINYYFDSPSLGLRKKKIGLRIRILGSQKAIVTIKFPKPSKKNTISSLKMRYEYEAPISVKVAKKILKGKRGIETLAIEPITILKSKTAASLLKRLVCLGELTTQRTIYHYNRDFSLELDESTYFGKTFYELEVETKKPKGTDKEVRKLLKKMNVKCRPENISKLQRFLKEWKQAKKKRLKRNS